MKNKKRVAIITNNLICETNTKYYSTLEKYFKSNGWEVTTNFDTDMVVFSTCGYSDMMFRVINNALEELKSINFPNNNIVMMCCLPKTHGTKLQEVFNGITVEFGKEAVLDGMIGAKIKFSEINGTNVFKAPEQTEKSSKEELFNIQISDGCLKQCTFCVVNKAHGDLRSMPLEEIVEQYKMAIGNGYRNINLVGIDTLGYGHDTGTNVIELIHYLLAIEPDVKFYLGSLHSRWLKLYWEGLLQLCKRNVINSLHAVIQHSNDELLKKMGRPVQFSEMYGTICRFKKECPELFISTDVIVGFPGETEEMFKELVDVIKNDKCFSLINHYTYSDVKGSSSYNFKDKINEFEKANRWKVLNEAIGKRSPAVALNMFESPKYNRYKGVFNSYNPKGYYYCKGTYEEI
jgi:MiaB/RimO family radical SAM methylthiotransferase